MMSQALSEANILNGFKIFGIDLFNSDIFGEENFKCSSQSQLSLSANFDKQLDNNQNVIADFVPPVALVVPVIAYRK